MTDAEDLLAIPEELAGIAKHWFNAMHSGWEFWGDFCIAARSHFGKDQNYQSNLEMQIQNRSQGPNEPVRSYIFSVLAMMSKLDSPYEDRKKLVILHNNLKHEIKSYLWAKNYRTVEDFIQQAISAEETIESKASYKPPPTPKQSLIPELAYRPITRKTNLKIKAQLILTP